ncbi:hypothetical protein [uncultured Dokdonia sp.]|uniref:hypothetical protein n=1 Tax=uncultured Dokdonia sp. TaxID=575653 RepID=UPI0026157A5D|nr:hypothetical protein [uncultured Dokdonia sp.]
MKFLLILLSFVIFISDSGKISELKSNLIPTKEDVWNFKGWKPLKVFKENGENRFEWTNERWDKKTDFKFEIKPTTENRTYFSRPTSSLKVKNGWLIGFNKGEWSGALFWFSENGKESYLVKEKNVHNILQLGDRIYITQGLSHLGGDFGTVSEIAFNKKWFVAKTEKLSGCPFQSIIFNDKLLILTTKNIILANSKLELTEKVDNGFWSGLYPNSVITEENTAYFGMRGGILKVNFENGINEWLTE